MHSIFDSLRAILKEYEPNLSLVHDIEDKYYLDCKPTTPKEKPKFFAAVTVQKNYVSFYFFPVYCNPLLGANLSPELLKRRQGKSCFNFKKDEPELFQELAGLCRSGYEHFIDLGWIEAA